MPADKVFRRRGWLRTGLLALTLAGCAVNPATGSRSLPSLIGPETEEAIGDREHQAVLKKFGGIYRHPGLDKAVHQVVARLAPHVRVADDSTFDWRVWLLDDPTPNAFALPGGRLYFTRGFLALTNDEAELAAVVGHEMGHVAARHSATRLTATILVGIGRVLAQIAIGGRTVSAQAQDVADLTLAAYSRANESEADSLGARYLSAAGYDVNGVTRVLTSLLRWHDYQTAIGAESSGFSLYQTHPMAEDRIAAAEDWAHELPAGTGGQDRAAHIGGMRGLAWGGAPGSGYVRGRVFLHPELGISFTVPEGYRLSVDERRIVAEQPQTGGVILVDMAANPDGLRPLDYLKNHWAADLALTDVKRRRWGGFAAATGQIRPEPSRPQVEALLAVLAHDERRVFRFICIAPDGGLAPMAAEFMVTLESFHSVTRSDMRKMTAERLDILTAQPGESIAGLAARQGWTPHAEQLLRAINGLPEAAEPAPGQLIKFIVAD